MEPEGIEQEILLAPEGIQVGKVNSVNGQTGDVVLTTSDLENTSDYQTGTDLTNAISAHNESEEAHPYIQSLIENKQDTLIAGNNIQISEENVISATNTTYSAGNGLNLSGENEFSVDTTVVATQTDLSNEVTNRENADIALQQQIDGISASSDVVDIVGTYQDLQNYDTQDLKDNDIIKVLQDSTENNATTYYRWSTSTQTFTLIGQEGPYYTKAAADAQFVPQTRTVNGKALSSNITLNASDVSALGTADVVQTTGTSTSQVMSQNSVTNELNNKLNTSDYVVDTALANSTNPVQNQVLYNLFGTMPSDFFTGTATANDTGTSLQFDDAISVDDVQLLGDTTQQTYSGKNLLPFTSQDFTVNNVHFYVGDGTLYANGNSTGETYSGNINWQNNFSFVLPAGTYTLSLDTVFTNCYIKNKSSGDNLAMVNGDTIKSATFTLAEETEVYLGFYMYQLSLSNLEIPLMLESGSPATSYEPYVGGTASPNPDYPQTVNVVTGEQSVVVSGKNLFNYQSISNLAVAGSILNEGSSYRGYYIKVFEGQQYTVSRATTTGNNRNRVCFTTTEPAQGVSYFGLEDYDTQLSYTVTVPSGANYMFLYLSNGSQTISENLHYQIEYGNTATTWVPFLGIQAYTVDLGSIELCKIGTYQDYIYKSGDDWYVHKETGKVVYDGSENYTVSQTQAQNYLRLITTDKHFAPTVAYMPTDQYYNNYFTKAPSVEVVEANYICSTMYATYFSIPRTLATDDTTFKTWLSTHNVLVYYALDTPTDTQITDGTLISQLNALSTALCYAGETNIEITASGTNLPAPLDITVFNANAQGIIAKIRGN